jgi:hypothetical protein
MANQIPIKVMCDGSGNTCGLAQFTSSDSLAVSVGGTGITTQGICAYTQPGLYVVGCQVTYLGICAGKADTGAGHDNTYVGHSAGTAVTTGCQHTIIGSQAGKAITTCNGTVAIGYNAGLAQTFGDFNTLIGTAGGAAITTASSNTVIGYHAATATICSNNVAIGTCAMVANTQGQDNIAIGVKAGATQVAAGCNNVFVGSNAGAVSLCRDNVSIGSYAGKAATTGGGNVMIGACVGYGVVGGASNVYIGDKAGLGNTSGNANVFIGKCAGCANTSSCCLIIGNGTCDLITGNFSAVAVGIGTTAPEQSLDVYQADANDHWVQVVNPSNTNIDVGFRAETYPGDGTEYITMFSRNDDTTQHINFSHTLSIDEAATAVMTIAAGNVGIGTATVGALLHLNKSSGDPDIQFSVGGTDKWIFGVDDSDGDFLKINLGGTLGANTGEYAFYDGYGFAVVAPEANEARLYLVGDNGDDATDAWRINSDDGKLEFQTRTAGTSAMPANSDTWTERMQIDADGQVGIGTTTPGYKLDIAETAATPVAHFLNSNASDSYGLQLCAGNDANDYAMRIQDRTGTELFRIQGGGDVSVSNGGGLVVGHTALLATGSTSELQVIGTTTADSSMSLQNFQNEANAGAMIIGTHSRSGTIGTYTVLQDDDRIFTIQAQGVDGTDAATVAGSIDFYVDGTPGSNDMPGRIEFKTTCDGQSSATTRMTIDQAGNVGIGTTPGRVGTSQWGTSHTFLNVAGSGTNSGIVNIQNATTADNYDVGTLVFSSSGLDAAYRDIAGIYGQLDGGTSGQRGGALTFQTRADAATTWTERMRISSCGNVGIGVATPTSALHVAGIADFNSGLYINSASYGAWGLIDDSSNSSGTKTLYIGNASINVTSDKRAKKNIEDYAESALDLLDQARVVSFEYIPEMISDFDCLGPSARGKYVGLLAQEMIEWAPWAIHDQGGHPDAMWQAEYEHLVPTLVKAIQELRAKVATLEGQA